MKNAIDTKTAANAIAITTLYKVAFNKLPDAEGLAYWMNDMANGQSLHDVAHSFAPLLPQFGDSTTQAAIDLFVSNATGQHASQDVINHWGILAINAVPSFELAYELTLKLVGQPIDPWAVPLI